MKFQLKKIFHIESARSLPYLPKDHPCASIHGHSFQITLTLEGLLDSKLGWLIDYHEIHTKVAPVLAKIDHRLLNEVPGLTNPTTENLTAWLYTEIKKIIPELTLVTVKETQDTECSYPIF